MDSGSSPAGLQRWNRMTTIRRCAARGAVEVQQSLPTSQRSQIRPWPSGDLRSGRQVGLLNESLRPATGWYEWWRSAGS